MLKIVVLTGGLGNQMFAYAFYLALRNKNKYSYISLDASSAETHHNGYELDGIFSLVTKGTRSLLSSVYTKKYIHFLFKKNEQKATGFFYSLIANRSLFTIYTGFWQSERYFEYVKDEVRNTFKFKTELISERTRLILSIIKSAQSVSIHIRRGDYILNEELNNVCTKDYYIRAIQLILNKVYKPLFYVFTDDPDWVKINLTELDYTLIDWNTAKDNWQDMFLMSNCKHNIIANSTFSWWGAWLNANQDKIVIAPNKWFNTLHDDDIVPKNWIRI